MKRFIAIATVFGLFTCVQASHAQKSTVNGLPQGAVATTTNGFTMTAKINGKAVKATAMMPPDEDRQIVGYYDGPASITLFYDKNNMVAGNKVDFSKHNAALTTIEEHQLWDGRKGEMEITKVTGKWVEGKFFFTAYSYDYNSKKKMEVTDGFFRIMMK